MARFQCALLDIGGVVYVGDAPLPGAVAAIERLRAAGIGLRFLTNTTRTAHGSLCAKLRGMGVGLADEELFTPARAARAVLERGNLVPHLVVHPALEAEFVGLPETGRKAVVVGDAGDAFTYDTLNAAFRALEQGGEFLALANNRTFRDADGELSLDAGPFVAALAFAARREPVVLGKPAPDYFHAALASLGCSAADAVMIGDDAESDVGGAMAAGLAGILVRTGKYRDGDESSLPVAPSRVAGDLAAAVDWILA